MLLLSGRHSLGLRDLLGVQVSCP